MKPTLVVLAAGMGSRYGGMKQIDPVGAAGEAIIDYSIYDAIRAGFDRVVFVIRKEIEEQVRGFFSGKFEGSISVDYVYQEFDDIPPGFSVPPDRTKPWGTAHAVLAARSAVDAPFAVINGDDFYGMDAFVRIAGYLSDLSVGSTDYAMVAYRLDRTLSEHGTVSRGIVSVDVDGWLAGIEEHTKIARDGAATENAPITSYGDDGGIRAHLDADTPTSMNMFGFAPTAMELFQDVFVRFLERHGSEPKSEFYIPYAMNELAVDGRARMRVLTTTSDWFGVTYQADRPMVVDRIRTLIRAGAYPAALWK